jgi:hypothetical protein
MEKMLELKNNLKNYLINLPHEDRVRLITIVDDLLDQRDIEDILDCMNELDKGKQNHVITDILKELKGNLQLRVEYRITFIR